MQGTDHSIEIPLSPSVPRPYFAEIPYYLWGEVNYNSEGDCRYPTDRDWHYLEIEHRDTRESVSIEESEGVLRLEGSIENIARLAYFLKLKAGTNAINDNTPADLGEWDHVQAEARTHRIQREFPRDELKLFDNYLFWGSWKWIGWFGTEYIWVGRWIMNSVLTGDTRAVCLCVDWLKDGTVDERQSLALRDALHRLTKLNCTTDEEWVAWYYRTGKKLYPKPDFKKWLSDLQQ